jgi:HD superfamily phosphohydrolase YqeK
VSAALAREELGVEDPAVLRAAARHTLGQPSMGELDKTVFVADMAAGDRSFPGVAGLRRLALRDLDAAAALAARLKVDWLRRTGKWIHPLGLETCLELNR